MKVFLTPYNKDVCDSVKKAIWADMRKGCAWFPFLPLLFCLLVVRCTLLYCLWSWLLVPVYVSVYCLCFNESERKKNTVDVLSW